MLRKKVKIIIGVIAIIAVLLVAGFFISTRYKNKTTNEHDKQIGTFKFISNLFFTGKSVALDYSEFDTQAAINISFFEENMQDEIWKGSGFFDDHTFYAGSSSLCLASVDHTPNFATLEKELKLQDVQVIELYINVAGSPYDLESLSIKFGDNELQSYYEYSISNLKIGWNYIRIPAEWFLAFMQPNSSFNWSKVTRTQLSLVSRPQSSVFVNFDNLRAEKNDIYLDDWTTKDSNFLGFGKGLKDQKIYLYARNVGAQTATIKEILGSKDFTYEAIITPLKLSPCGLFFRGNYRNNYGYYFIIGGYDSSSWMLYKTDETGYIQLDKGELDNFAFQNNEKYWLRVITNGNKIEAFLSLDGIDFEKLTTVYDSRFPAGGVGIAVLGGGEALFNSFKFEQ